jgi:hypothetical protein
MVGAGKKNKMVWQERHRHSQRKRPERTATMAIMMMKRFGSIAVCANNCVVVIEEEKTSDEWKLFFPTDVA